MEALARWLNGAVSIGDAPRAKQLPFSQPQARIVDGEAGQVVDGVRELRIFPVLQLGTGPMRLLALRSPWVVTDVTAKAAIHRELPRTRDQSIDLRGSIRIALEDCLSLPCRDGHRIERRDALWGRYRVQALEAGAESAQALGGLQPRRSPLSRPQRSP